MAVNLFKNLFSRVGDTWKKDESVVGIDIGSSFIKAVQIKKKEGRAVLETYGEIALGPYGNLEVGQATNLSPEKITEALKDLFKEAGITTKNAALSIPLKSSLLSVIKVPKLDSEKEINEMIPIEARKYIPVPISEITLDWWIVPKRESEKPGSEDAEVEKKEDDEEKLAEKKETMEVMVVAIHNETVSNYQDIIKKMELKNVFFELEIFSTIRSTFGHGMPEIMLMDIGAGSTKIAIVEYGVVRFSHIISKGSQNISSAISKSLSVSFSKAEDVKKELGVEAVEKSENTPNVVSLNLGNLFSEANTTLLEYQRKYGVSIGKVILTGGGALLKGLSDIATQNMDAEVVFGDSFGKVEAPVFLEPVLREAGPEFAVAVGLALRKLQDAN